MNGKQMYKWTFKKVELHTYRQTDSRTERWRNRRTVEQIGVIDTDRKASRKIDKDRQTGRQTSTLCFS